MSIIELSNDTVSLVEVDETYATEIFNANYGNVKEYFAKFDNIKDTKKWLKATLTLVNYGTKLEFCILDRHKEFLGMVSIDNLDIDISDFKIWVEAQHQKKGIATQASYLILEYFKTQYPEKRLRYTAENNNEASVALAKKIGFNFVRNYKDDNNKSTTVFVYNIFNNQE
jgi:RimJ/RimL family protein N-acetyltransferase